MLFTEMLMENHMRVSITKEKEVVMESIPTIVELLMRVVGKQIKSMEMEFIPSQMESDMKVSTKMEFVRELESTSTNVEMYMKDHGLMMKDMEKLTTHLQMVR